jgi:crooked neck
LFLKFQGNALGRCRLKKKLYRFYVEMEIKLREFDRCRKLYEKFLSHFESNSMIWREFAQLEYQLGEVDRARAILELGIQQENLDVPEVST